jgi:modulator of FtsH protease HflK
MTDERADIAAALKKALQAEVDRLGLGLEILFVGLKDIHPPVDVAPAYQEVISAQEQKERMIDSARAARAETLPGANAEATRLKAGADAEYNNRVARASGEAARFTIVADAQRASGDIFRTRVRLDALQESLAKPVKVILGVPATANGQYYLDLRNTADLPPP